MKNGKKKITVKQAKRIIQKIIFKYSNIQPIIISQLFKWPQIGWREEYFRIIHPRFEGGEATFIRSGFIELAEKLKENDQSI